MERNNEQWKSREVARLLALVETERRYYQEMVANLPVSVAVINQQGNLVAANRAFRQYYDVQSGDLRKRSIHNVFSSDELQARIHSVFESGLGSRPLVLDRVIPASGAPQRLRVSVQAIRDWDEDSGLQALVLVEDLETITETTAATPEPAAAVAPPLPATVEPVPVPTPAGPLPCVLWTARASDRVFTHISPSAKTLLDIDSDEWLQSPNAFIERIAAPDRDQARAFFVHALQSPGLHSCEFHLRRPGVWYRETILVEAGSDSITGVITDITARRQMEEQILQSQRFDALTHLAGRMAHDINNPLMIVNGYAEDLATALPPGDPHTADLREIQSAGKRIGEITSHLQAVTRKQHAILAPVDVDAELAKVVDRMRQAAGEYLQADHTPGPHPLTVHADASQLDAILLELSAALVEGGGETAHLVLSAQPYRAAELVHAAQPLTPGLDFVEISIVNQSQAAPPLNPHLFESLLPGKDPGHEGGPALAKAYRTIQEWGGSILTLPSINEIRVYLKAAPAPPPPPPPDEHSPVGAPKLTPSSAPPTAKTVEFVRKTSILIVEDEPGIRALMRKILQREGFDVMEAASGAEALQIVKDSGPFNLLITDIVMRPGMSGLELATQVKAMDAYCGILYMSGFTADTGVETGQFPPGSHFLQKPFTLGSLLRKANEVLASTPRRPAD